MGLGVEVWGGAQLSLGRGIAVGQRCYLDARGGIRIDDHASVSREACLLTATHQVNDPDFSATLAGIHLGTRSWVGTRAMLLPGVRIGEGAIVGAGAVVSKDVEPYTVVAGVPARVIATRSQPLSYEQDWRPNWY